MSDEKAIRQAMEYHQYALRLKKYASRYLDIESLRAAAEYEKHAADQFLNGDANHAYFCYKAARIMHDVVDAWAMPSDVMLMQEYAEAGLRGGYADDETRVGLLHLLDISKEMLS